MEITIGNISGTDIAKNDKISVEVIFTEKIGDYVYSATVRTWVSKSDATINQINEQAKEAAKGFIAKIS
jgi:hypothetical protein